DVQIDHVGVGAVDGRAEAPPSLLGDQRRLLRAEVLVEKRYPVRKDHGAVFAAPFERDHARSRDLAGPPEGEPGLDRKVEAPYDAVAHSGPRARSMLADLRRGRLVADDLGADALVLLVKLRTEAAGAGPVRSAVGGIGGRPVLLRRGEPFRHQRLLARRIAVHVAAILLGARVVIAFARL